MVRKLRILLARNDINAILKLSQSIMLRRRWYGRSP
jgi:hypothetical protein